MINFKVIIAVDDHHSKWASEAVYRSLEDAVADTPFDESNSNLMVVSYEGDWTAEVVFIHSNHPLTWNEDANTYVAGEDRGNLMAMVLDQRLVEPVYGTFIRNPGGSEYYDPYDGMGFLEFFAETLERERGFGEEDVSEGREVFIGCFEDPGCDSIKEGDLTVLSLQKLKWVEDPNDAVYGGYFLLDGPSLGITTINVVAKLPQLPGSGD